LPTGRREVLASAADTPFVPNVGELYWVATQILLLPDPKEWRPAVVVERPSGPFGRVHVVTRTTDTTRKGVEHQPVAELGLRLPGVFWRYSTAEARMWTPGTCRLMGMLDAVTLRRVMVRFA
jgi:hypothetical protein